MNNSYIESCNKADEFYKEERFENAINYYENAFSIAPNEILAIRIATCWNKIKPYAFFEEQLIWINKAIEINPNSTIAYRNLAILHSKFGNNKEAQQAFGKLLTLQPIADDYYAYACTCFKLKNFDQAWKYFDKRFEKVIGKTDYPQILKPQWDGKKTDKTLLINYEQGFGDTFMFCRFIKLVKPLVGKIIFRVQKELYKLIKDSFTDIEVVSEKVKLKDLIFDYHIPLMSIPAVLNLVYEDFTYQKNLIQPDMAEYNFYKANYYNNDNFKIGFAFHGAANGNPRRNIPPKNFLKLLEIPNAKLYSFQKNYNQELHDKIFENKLINLGNTFKDFSDTVAALKGIDLFVTSDNVLLNLAGTLGIKTCLLLAKDSEWRWFKDDKKTIWYDSVEVFKKEQETDDWKPLFDKVVEKFS